MDPLVVRKRDLPVPVVVEDDNGTIRVLELAPAREGKLGAFLRDISEPLRRNVTLWFRRRKR